LRVAIGLKKSWTRLAWEIIEEKKTEGMEEKIISEQKHKRVPNIVFAGRGNGNQCSKQPASGVGEKGVSLNFRRKGKEFKRTKERPEKTPYQEKTTFCKDNPVYIRLLWEGVPTNLERYKREKHGGGVVGCGVGVSGARLIKEEPC